MTGNITEAEKKRFALVVRYERINPTTWRRIEWPEIEEKQTPWSDEYSHPQIKKVQYRGKLRQVVKVRIVDPQSVDLDSPDRLGDWDNAARMCEDALLREFPETSVNNSRSAWRV